jgi:hypothetical protein
MVQVRTHINRQAYLGRWRRAHRLGEETRLSDLGFQPRRVAESGENWYWGDVDQFAFELEGAPEVPSHP